MVFVVIKGYFVNYKWTKDLPGWMRPFIIKLPVLILRRASEVFLVCTEFWDGQECYLLGCLSFAGGRTQCIWAWKSQIRVHGSLDSLMISEMYIEQCSGHLSWELKEAWQRQELLNTSMMIWNAFVRVYATAVLEHFGHPKSRSLCHTWE